MWLIIPGLLLGIYAQIKLSVVASDIFGVSGRQMMAALIAGQRDPKVLAQLARGRMRGKISQLEEAFTGYFTDHHSYRCWGLSSGGHNKGKKKNKGRYGASFSTGGTGAYFEFLQFFKI